MRFTIFKTIATPKLDLLRNEIEELLVKRCNVLREMKEEIRNLTHYHWLNPLGNIRLV